jgi:hypothetical protein
VTGVQTCALPILCDSNEEATGTRHSHLSRSFAR